MCLNDLFDFIIGSFSKSDHDLCIYNKIVLFSPLKPLYNVVVGGRKVQKVTFDFVTKIIELSSQ